MLRSLSHPQGAAVKRQRLLYDRSLETRILLQKCLAGGNQMPPPTTRQLALAHAPQLAQPYSDLAAAAQSTLLQLLELQGALLTNNPGAQQSCFLSKHVACITCRWSACVASYFG